ncbi:unnamed protein product [Tuber aestivum]|uniref:Regulator of chromosome condensation 1/beta-lactamase-inhibitor protein II n=1 Tax=Tuber aestivum TaxID=59557 RepID=A0A292Q4S2_9PEZI|nr:unnamed protein product [Tuber aestivum]
MAPGGDSSLIIWIAAGESISIAVTDAGQVCGWGTFRCDGGILGFNDRTSAQHVPALLPTLKSIVQVSIGTDHVLGLTKEGEGYAWGNGQQFQLGGRVLERNRHIGLIHRRVSLPRCQVKHVATGSYHSFAMTQDGRVWTWRLNQYGQCGIYNRGPAARKVPPFPSLLSPRVWCSTQSTRYPPESITQPP